QAEYLSQCSRALKQHGGMARSRLTSALPILLRQYAPPRARRLLHRAKLMRPANLVVYDFDAQRWNVLAH
ncbi:MAG: hypothetical protein ACI9W2_004661, partial [Gammaproteobacteria bacterium]